MPRVLGFYYGAPHFKVPFSLSTSLYWNKTPQSLVASINKNSSFHVILGWPSSSLLLSPRLIHAGASSWQVSCLGPSAAGTAGFLFPYALLSWASLCCGGLEAAFQENEGRNYITLSVPNSGTYKTPLGCILLDKAKSKAGPDARGQNADSAP